MKKNPINFMNINIKDFDLNYKQNLLQSEKAKVPQPKSLMEEGKHNRPWQSNSVVSREVVRNPQQRKPKVPKPEKKAVKFVDFPIENFEKPELPSSSAEAFEEKPIVAASVNVEQPVQPEIFKVEPDVPKLREPQQPEEVKVVLEPAQEVGAAPQEPVQVEDVPKDEVAVIEVWEPEKEVPQVPEAKEQAKEEPKLEKAKTHQQEKASLGDIEPIQEPKKSAPINFEGLEVMSDMMMSDLGKPAQLCWDSPHQ